MTLHAIVAVLGGDLYQGGLRANIPAPGHSRADRSASLLLDGDRLVIHSFGATHWRTVRDHLHALGLIHVDGRLAGGHLHSGRLAQGCWAGDSRSLAARSTARLDAARRIETANRLWAGTLPIVDGDLCALHLRRRAIDASPASIDDLRRHPGAPISVFSDNGPTCPALAAAVRSPSGRLSAVELTYLDADGCRARRLRLARKTVGRVPAGAAVRLAPAGSDLVVGEGVMTTLSASARFRRPGWALLSAGNLAQWTPPEMVRRVIIAADRGPAGETAAARLLRRLRSLGLAACLRPPPEPFGDWNEVAGFRKGERDG